MNRNACVRYLPDGEKNRTRELWTEAFPEDSRQFLDYYYSEKMRDNRVLVKEGNGRIVPLLHPTPSRMAVGDGEEVIDYIVAVATAADSRHRGHMRDLLGRMLRDMYAEQMPFTFLMPADEVIYRPFQFAFICDQESWEESEELSVCAADGKAGETGRIREQAGTRTADSAGGVPQTGLSQMGDSQIVRVKVCGENDVREAARYMNEWLRRRYQVYCLRDREYVERLVKELQSENGFLEMLVETAAQTGVSRTAGRMLRADGKDPEAGQMLRAAEAGSAHLAGLKAVWGLEKQEQRLLMTDEGLSRRREPEKPKPSIMARIAYLPGFLAPVRLDPACGEAELQIHLKVEDPMIPENNGSFLWTVGADGSRLELLESEIGPGEGPEILAAADISAGAARKRPSDRGVRLTDGSHEVLEISIQNLAQWIFGYGPAAAKYRAQFPQIRTWEGVFIDEVV